MITQNNGDNDKIFKSILVFVCLTFLLITVFFWPNGKSLCFKMSKKSPLLLLRLLSRELRQRSNKKLLDRPLMQWILSEFRSNQITQEQYCRSPKEMTWVADTYCQYLRAQRLCRELVDKSQKREKTIQETADMVGFRLPQFKPDSKTD